LSSEFDISFYLYFSICTSSYEIVTRGKIAAAETHSIQVNVVYKYM